MVTTSTDSFLFGAMKSTVAGRLTSVVVVTVVVVTESELEDSLPASVVRITCRCTAAPDSSRATTAILEIEVPSRWIMSGEAVNPSDSPKPDGPANPGAD